MSKVSPPWDPIRWREVRPDARQKMRTHTENQQVDPEIKGARQPVRGSAEEKSLPGSRYQGVMADMNAHNAKMEAAPNSRQSPALPAWKEDQNSLAPSAVARPRASLASPRLAANITTSNHDNAIDYRRPSRASPSMTSWHPDYRRDSSVTIDRSVASHHSEPASSLGKLSLPSLASFHEGVWRQDNSAMSNVNTASFPPSSAVSNACWCSRLAPMVQTAAKMVRGLETTLRGCAPRNAHRFEFRAGPHASPVDTLQWIIDTLSLAEQEANGPEMVFCSDTGYGLKRPGHFDERSSKRPRRDNEGRMSATPPASASRANEQGNFYEGRRTSSSPVTLPLLDLTQAKPNMAPSRLLPSPSSLVHSASGAALHSFTDHVSPPGSARLSNMTSSSMHQGSSAAASQHIADLQHQISVKTLALESLQKEHTNLLQKWHRERVKIHAIEKKCQVSDQEINDLTAKNEDAIEQIKILELQVTNHEGRREADASTYSREKEQWSRMLEMSGRLHLKVSEERKRLLEENAALEKRVLWFEQESRIKHGRTVDSDGATTSNTVAIESGHGELPPFGSITESRLLSTHAASMANALQSQVDNLRAALESAKEQNTNMEQAAKDLLAKQKSLTDAIEQALVPSKEDQANAGTSDSHSPAGSIQVRSKEVNEADTKPTANPTERSEQSKPSKIIVQDEQKQHVAKILESVGSTSTPLPSELGIEVLPTKSSPEEIIIALGPVPSPSNLETPNPPSSEYTSLSARATPVHKPSSRHNEYQDFLKERATSVPRSLPASALATSQG